MRPLRLAFLILDIAPIAHLQAFLYLYQVCEALAYTHSMGIIHRCPPPPCAPLRVPK